MSKLLKQVLALTGAMILACVLVGVFTRGRFDTYLPSGMYDGVPEGIEYEQEGEGRVVMERIGPESGGLQLSMRPDSPGTVYVSFHNKENDFSAVGAYRVLGTGHIIDESNGNFTGDRAVLVIVTVYVGLMALTMLLHFKMAKGPDFYSYETIYAAGFFVFLTLTAFVLVLGTVYRTVNPARFSMMDFYNSISGSSVTFVNLTSPLILLFAVLMIVSNVELLRHERKRLANVLGILISILMLAGAALILWLAARDFMGSDLEGRIHTTIINIAGTIYMYFECMLFGSVLCGLMAARHKAGPVQDYLIILGCRFRKDGSLTPLLKGRVDRAIAFFKEQRDTTGKSAVFVPSGGQGSDESMPEAEAMRRYLSAQGIPDELILVEDQSKNTYQNMAFSKKIIEEDFAKGTHDAGAPRVLFSTTNYHVFRGGVWASLAGLRAEGIGSPTKWWFWPNAFMRECIGLLQNRWKQEVLFLAVLVVIFAGMSMFLH